MARTACAVAWENAPSDGCPHRNRKRVLGISVTEAWWLNLDWPIRLWSGAVAVAVAVAVAQLHRCRVVRYCGAPISWFASHPLALAARDPVGQRPRGDVSWEGRLLLTGTRAGEVPSSLYQRAGA